MKPIDTLTKIDSFDLGTPGSDEMHDYLKVTRSGALEKVACKENASSMGDVASAVEKLAGKLLETKNKTDKVHYLEEKKVLKKFKSASSGLNKLKGRLEYKRDHPKGFIEWLFSGIIKFFYNRHIKKITHAIEIIQTKVNDTELRVNEAKPNFNNVWGSLDKAMHGPVGPRRPISQLPQSAGPQNSSDSEESLKWFSNEPPPILKSSPRREISTERQDNKAKGALQKFFERPDQVERESVEEKPPVEPTLWSFGLPDPALNRTSSQAPEKGQIQLQSLENFLNKGADEKSVHTPLKKEEFGVSSKEEEFLLTTRSVSIEKAKQILEEHDLVFSPSVNEEIALFFKENCTFESINGKIVPTPEELDTAMKAFFKHKFPFIEKNPEANRLFKEAFSNANFFSQRSALRELYHKLFGAERLKSRSLDGRLRTFEFTKHLPASLLRDLKKYLLRSGLYVTENPFHANALEKEEWNRALKNFLNERTGAREFVQLKELASEGLTDGRAFMTAYLVATQKPEKILNREEIGQILKNNGYNVNKLKLLREEGRRENQAKEDLLNHLVQQGFSLRNNSLIFKEDVQRFNALVRDFVEQRFFPGLMQDERPITGEEFRRAIHLKQETKRVAEEIFKMKPPVRVKPLKEKQVSEEYVSPSVQTLNTLPIIKRHRAHKKRHITNISGR